MSVQNNVKQNLTEQEIKGALKLAINVSPLTGKKISRKESVEELKQLMKKGFNINYRYPDQENWTLLHFVTYFKNEDMFDELISLGADHTLLLEHEVSLLHIAATKNLSKSCKKILSKNFNVDALTERKKTALMNACEAGGLETVKVCINAGANIELKDSESKDCFYYADKFAKNNYDSEVSTFLSETLMYKDIKIIKTKSSSIGAVRKF